MDGMNEAMRAGLAALWVKVRPGIVTRVGALQADLDRLVDVGTATEARAAAREDARREAHKLAGTLGSYLRRDGGEAAKHLEHVLEGDGAVDAVVVAELMERIRASLDEAAT